MTMLSYDLDIDWNLLAEQKEYLLQLIDADCKAPAGLTGFGPYAQGSHPLDGLISLLDSIQDQADKRGEPVYVDQEDE